jgi:trimethylamine--corrinoid protein Co-methyltransferase
MNLLIPMLSWPDLMVGCGLLGGSMILSLEQLLIDVEVFRMAKQSHRGILTNEEKWLDEDIQRVGPGGNFLGEKTTAANMRSGEWLIPRLGIHETHQAWENSGRKDILEDARERVDQLLRTHQSLPLGNDKEKELATLLKNAEESEV